MTLQLFTYGVASTWDIASTHDIASTFNVASTYDVVSTYDVARKTFFLGRVSSFFSLPVFPVYSFCTYSILWILDSVGQLMTPTIRIKMRYEILSKTRYEIQSEITRLIRIIIFKYDKGRILTVYLVQSEYLPFKYQARKP